MNTTLALPAGASAALLLLLLPAAAGRPVPSPLQQKEPITASQLVRDVVWNEIHAQLNDKTEWEYRESRNEGGDTQLLHVVQTKYGDLHRLLAVNGVPLTPSQQAAEERRIQRLLANPDQTKDAARKSHQDAEEERKMLRMLPNAFDFRYEKHAGDTITLAFTPNPSFHADSHESEVFHHMEGHLLVYAPGKRLEEIDGRLTSPVKFWGGLLGHLDQGGTFHVVQKNVGSNHWELTSLNVQMDGKALFFKTIAVRQKEIYTEFKRVPDDITLPQAAERLKQPTAG
ncbi:MAG TPA: hypothetical protein VN661_02670 [Candidatus Acidoferrales bacterium]|nr:hypothetical protein [Candidatus Acidoferrales bacterium]